MKIILKAPLTLSDFWRGYSVEPNDTKTYEESDLIQTPYKITGPKQNWILMRNIANPSMLFPIPEDTINGHLKIKGISWFKEIVDGENTTLIPSI